MNYWDILGINPTHNIQEIKKAYAEQVKNCHPEDNPEGFKQLQEAYKFAQKRANLVEQSVRDENQESQSIEQEAFWQDAEGNRTPLEERKTSQNEFDFEIFGKSPLQKQEIEQEETFDFSELEQKIEESSSLEQIREMETNPFESDFQALEKLRPHKEEAIIIESSQEFVDSWTDLEESISEIKEEEQLIHEIMSRLGMAFPFENLQQICQDSIVSQFLTKNRFAKGLEEVLLETYMFGKWSDRQQLITFFKKYNMHKLAEYVAKIGLTVASLEGTNTELEGWKRK